MRIKHLRNGGFTLVEIMIVVAIIGLLVSIAIPNFVRARSTSQQNACISNMRNIDCTKDQWALEEGKSDGDSCSMNDVVPYLRKKPECPVGNTAYIANAVGVDPECQSTAATEHNAAFQN